MPKIKIPETRGRKPKYDFSKLKKGEDSRHKGVSTQALLNAANYWAKRHDKGWKFRTYTDPDTRVSVLVRVA